MKRFTLMVGLLGTAFLLMAQAAQAQMLPAKIYLKSKPGAPTELGIAQESKQGVRLVGQTAVVPADDIEDIDYVRLIEKTSTRVTYDAGMSAEKEAVKAPTRAKREELLETALGKYNQTLKEMPADLYAPRRHVEFKVAYLTGLLGLGSEKQIYRIDGIKKLNEFRDKHADAWQTTPALLMLVKLHAEMGNFDEVKTTATKLGDPGLPPRAKHEAKMLVARLFMDSGKDLVSQKKSEEAAKQFTEAQTALTSLLAELPPDSPLKLHALLAQAQCKAVSKDEKVKQEATKELEKMLKETTEKELRAVVYNNLGELYMNEGKMQDARWQFLWVDVIYNQDKEEHAKALYYLWKVFTNLNEPERGTEFFEVLTTNTRFEGTAFREKALKENKQAQ